jgi:hypothetical protein
MQPFGSHCVRIDQFAQSRASGGFGGMIMLCGGGRFGGFASEYSGLCGYQSIQVQPLALLRIAPVRENWEKSAIFAIPIGTTVYVARCREGGVPNQELRWT